MNTVELMFLKCLRDILYIVIHGVGVCIRGLYFPHGDADSVGKRYFPAAVDNFNSITTLDVFNILAKFQKDGYDEKSYFFYYAVWCSGKPVSRFTSFLSI